MKKVILISMAMLFAFGSNVMAQQVSQDEKKAEKEAQKEARKAAKEAEKKREAAIGELAFRQALKALEEKQFVLEAERVEFKRGTSTIVNSTTNFVMVNGEEATIQLNANAAFAGPNGMGGITVDGLTSNVVMTTDKKGNINYSMNVQGAAVSASVSFRMVKGSNQCSVTVTPNFNSNRITFRGPLIPMKQSRVFKGSAL